MARTRSKLLDLLDPRVRDVAPPGASADLLLRLQTAFQRGLEVGKSIPHHSTAPVPPAQASPAPPPPDAEAAKKAEKEAAARNECFEVYMDDARLMCPGAADEVLQDALETYKPLQEQFETGYVPSEAARIGALKRALVKKGLWQAAPDDTEGQLAALDARAGTI